MITQLQLTIIIIIIIVVVIIIITQAARQSCKSTLYSSRPKLGSKGSDVTHILDVTPHGNLSMQNRWPNAFNREERTVTINRFMRCLRYITFVTTELEGTVMKGIL